MTLKPFLYFICSIFTQKNNQRVGCKAEGGCSSNCYSISENVAKKEKKRKRERERRERRICLAGGFDRTQNVSVSHVVFFCHLGCLLNHILFWEANIGLLRTLQESGGVEFRWRVFQFLLSRRGREAWREASAGQTQQRSKGSKGSKGSSRSRQ